MYKVPYPLPPWEEKFIKSVGEDYQVVKKGREYIMTLGKNITLKKGRVKP